MELIGEFVTIGFNRTGYPQVAIKIYLNSDDIIYYTESYYLKERLNGLTYAKLLVTDFKPLSPHSLIESDLELVYKMIKSYNRDKKLINILE